MMPTSEAELLALKFKMEIVRTVCPILGILLQTIILVKIF